MGMVIVMEMAMAGLAAIIGLIIGLLLGGIGAWLQNQPDLSPKEADRSLLIYLITSMIIVIGIAYFGFSIIYQPSLDHEQWIESIFLDPEQWIEGAFIIGLFPGLGFFIGAFISIFIHLFIPPKSEQQK